MEYLGVEQMDRYRPGGYHPVVIGDVFHDKYRVINKLGNGVYGTVWLVENTVTGQFASLKIIVAEASTSASELDVVRRLKENQKPRSSNTGSEYVMEIFDEFLLEGPNGVHQCIVSELLGPSVEQPDLEDIFPEDCFPIGMAKKMCAQIVQGLSHLHRCKVVHGDLHPSNVLLRIPGIENWTRRDIETYFGHPQKLPIRDNDGNVITSTTPNVPPYVVGATNSSELLKLCLSSIDNIHIKICDFGESYLSDGPAKTTVPNMPQVFAAPEAIFFQEPVTPAIDVWALAVLMHMLLSGRGLLFASYHGLTKEVVREMWEERKEYFDDDAHFIGDTKLRPPVMGQFVKIYSDRMSPEEVAAFEELARKMVRYEPEDRLSVDEVARLIPADWINCGATSATAIGEGVVSR
ncbi:hypothetical protein M413DRAFT_445618 [Hebeloma cylindrosporum]|uniref:non-specific serine/threonine protein kinase n=1 Tax=Hebeloma cylindrosporum TaxID=76867 RepID=A0A0C2XVJ3_HEBCY|nr:hypothetical protein M413DRAFT_445618 [Hebeloma cylindrosporum h7]